MVNSNTNKRIINTNAIAEQKVRAWNGGTHFEEEAETGEGELPVEEPEDGFTDGIEAQVVEVDESPEAAEEMPSGQEVLEAANAEADALLEQARLEADAILAEAKAEAESLKEEAKALGYAEGAGEKEAELSAREAELTENLANREAELEQEYEERANRFEEDLVDVLIRVFRHVFGVQFDNKKEILLYLAQNTLADVEVGKEFKIRVSEENRAFFEENLETIRDQVGSDVSVEVVRDHSVGPEGCLLETGAGVFDCGIETEMTNLIKDIRSLCL